ncbi:MAG: FkbM family methyltransferase [bacterium]
MLKNILPKSFFSAILILWQKIFIKFVKIFDRIRLKNFTSYHPIKLTHQNKSFSLFISPENGCVDEYIYLYGIYEPNILDLITKYLKQGETFIDIGANIGQHSMFAASIVGNFGKVYSFEPIPRIYNQILDSVHLNNFDNIIKAYNFALGEKDTEQTLYITSENIGGSSLIKRSECDKKIEVKIIKGDNILLQLKQINLIKMDVEGYEYEALSGIHATLKKFHPIIVLEFNGDSYNKNDNYGDKIISLLNNLGYSLYDIGDYMKKIENKKDFLASFISERAQTDILCLPKNIIGNN